MKSLVIVFGLLATALVVRPLPHPDVLEPSVQNEVDHALAQVVMPPATTNAVVLAARADFARLYATNGLSATDRAIQLVSMQKEGRWTWHDQDVTPVAVRLLELLASP